MIIEKMAGNIYHTHQSKKQIPKYMNIVIPLGGLGSRFAKEGYHKPKPLVNVLGKQMIFWVLDNLNFTPEDDLYIICNKDLEQWDFQQIILEKYPQTHFIYLQGQTRGAAETMLIGLNQIDPQKRSRKCMTLDCDTFYTYDVISKYRSIQENNLFCFYDTQDKPIYSYVSPTLDGLINDVREKEKISNIANTGGYCFANGEILKQYCQKIVDQDIRQKDEFYISGVIREMLSDGYPFRHTIIPNEEFHCLGTPIHVKIFCNNYANFEKKRIVFDLDKTLVTAPTIPGDYSSVQPIHKNIDLCKYLKKQGHTIIVYTARRMRTHCGNLGSVIADVGEVTIKTLNDFKIPYDELYFGKPYAHFYIDDLAINAGYDIEKELGFYSTKVEERDFNQISTGSLSTIIKRGKDKILDGEIHWYKNIPEPVKHLFPIMVRYGKDNSYYELERIDGIPYSYLHINQSVTCELLNKLIHAIEAIHQSQEPTTQPNIYQNYKNKIMARYQSYDYSVYPNSQQTYQKLIDYFQEYETNNLGTITPIHGDPVFSNVLLDQHQEIKLIDMRGKLGDTLTILGDKWYDYGKMYQSLVGYDEILLGRVINNKHRDDLIQHFERLITELHGPETMGKIKMITASLLFTLIPLHHNDKCQSYYQLIESNELLHQ